MKRDMDLIREILLWAEGIDPAASPLPQFEVAEGDGHRVYQHMRLLEKAGYVEAAVTMGDPPHAHIMGMTWQGHDLLDSIRDAGVWAKVKTRVAEVGGSVPMELLKPLALEVLRDTLGLPPRSD